MQVLASITPVPVTSSQFNGLENVVEYFHKGLYKYAVGLPADLPREASADRGTPVKADKISNLEAAETLQAEMRRRGFKEAFVVAFYKEQRIAMRTALK